MIKYKYVLPAAVVRCLIYITMKYADHQKKEVGPNMAKSINEVSAPYFAEKRSYYHQRKYQQQEADKDQKRINGEKY